ncbi:flavin reductase family protein [Thiospirochaeta perfilievii]|uniref:Flavin reductase family protein n=1 Tax=Thiospirochaeta perfilievii TaxID=252967 RepID=A0A5C1QI62_9SPIO|nr:flavin reductase family protein [Thiospirochaeta perfilievii]QEN05932.1 flavin reductase family protein [Thiospirochaeta perfilievii]
MSKVRWKPGNLIYPLPAALVSCRSKTHGDNLITIAWTGTICTNPPMCYISIRPDRYSYDIINESKEFVINLTTTQMARGTDWCGVKSGRDYDKFKECGFTKGEAEVVDVPLVNESPLAIECKVVEIKELGSHHMFIANVVSATVDDKYLDDTGAFNLNQSDLICYSHREYRKLGQKIGHFGYAVKKLKKKPRRKKIN